MQHCFRATVVYMPQLYFLGARVLFETINARTRMQDICTDRLP